MVVLFEILVGMPGNHLCSHRYSGAINCSIICCCPADLLLAILVMIGWQYVMPRLRCRGRQRLLLSTGDGPSRRFYVRSRRGDRAVFVSWDFDLLRPVVLQRARKQLAGDYFGIDHDSLFITRVLLRLFDHLGEVYWLSCYSLWFLWLRIVSHCESSRRFYVLINGHRCVINIHRFIIGGAALLTAFSWFFPVPDTRVLVNLPRLFVFVEDRLCSGIINTKLIGCTPNRIGFQNKFKKLLAPLVANVIVRALSALSLRDHFRRLLLSVWLISRRNNRRVSLECNTFLIHCN